MSQILVPSRNLCTLSPKSFFGNVFTRNPSLSYRRPDALGNFMHMGAKSWHSGDFGGGSSPDNKKMRYSLLSLHCRNCFRINFCKANFEFNKITLQNWFWNEFCNVSVLNGNLIFPARRFAQTSGNFSTWKTKHIIFFASRFAQLRGPILKK